jgi:hypothetical protein
VNRPSRIIRSSVLPPADRQVRSISVVAAVDRRDQPIDRLANNVTDQDQGQGQSQAKSNVNDLAHERRSVRFNDLRDEIHDNDG